MAEVNTIPYFPTYLWSRHLNLDLKDIKKYCLDYQKGATFSVKKSNNLKILMFKMSGVSKYHRHIIIVTIIYR